MAKVLIVLVASITVMLLFSGCSGSGSSNRLDMSGNGSLSDTDMTYNAGQYLDLQPFTATRNGYIVIEMKTTASNSMNDPAIRVVNGNCTTADSYNTSFNNFGYVVRDDDSGAGLNAMAHFTANKNQTYTVAFTSYEAGDTGNYSWRIYETNSPPAAQSVNQNSANSKPVQSYQLNGGLISK